VRCGSVARLSRCRIAPPRRMRAIALRNSVGLLANFDRRHDGTRGDMAFLSPLCLLKKRIQNSHAAESSAV
jgi:hypothetical protein